MCAAYRTAFLVGPEFSRVDLPVRCHRTDRAGVLLQCHNIATRSSWPAHAAYRRLSAILPRIVLVCLVQAQVGTKFVDCTALYVGKLYILLLPGPVV